MSGCLFACLSVCLYPRNVKTAKPNMAKFGVGPHVAPDFEYVILNYLI